MKTIFVLGSLNMDLTVYTDSFPNEGETINGYDFHTCPGGKGLNQAIAASKLGANVKMLGMIGNDSFGKEMLDELKKNNVDISHIKIAQNSHSGIAQISVSNSENKIILDLGSNLLIKNEDIDAFLFDAKEGDIFLTQLETNLDAVSYALKIAKSKKMMTVVDPAPMNNEIVNFLENIDVLLPNYQELQGLLKIKAFKNTYKNHLVVTMGENGYSYTYKDTKISGKAVKVNAIDTTGAGDTFSGAFCYKLSCGFSISKEVLDFACLAASISTTKKGSSNSSPTLKEIKEFKA